MQVPEIKSQTGYSFVKLATGNILFAMQCQIFAATSYFSEVCCRPRRASCKRGSALDLCARKCPPCTSVIHGMARWKACAPKFAALLLYAERHQGTEAVQRSDHFFTTRHSSALQEGTEKDASILNVYRTKCTNLYISSSKKYVSVCLLEIFLSLKINKYKMLCQYYVVRAFNWDMVYTGQGAKPYGEPLWSKAWCSLDAHLYT